MAEEQVVPSEGLTLDQIFNVDSMLPEDSAQSPEEVIQQYQSRSPRAGAALPREALALLDTIAGTESPDYNTLYGGRKVANLGWHPGVHTKIQSGPNAGKTSSAAGRYQFLESTWNDQAMKLGLTDFSPASQDTAAWNLAQEAYNGKTGRDLLSDLQSGNPVLHARAGNVLSSIWTSLPGGIEQGTNTNKFLNAFQRNLAGAEGRAPASMETEGYDETPIPGLEPEQTAGPDLSNMYNIMLGDGSTLHVPNGKAPEEAIKEAMEAGIKGPFLKDIPLVNGGVLHAPWEQDPHAAMEEARAAMPDANLEAVFEQQHKAKTGFIPGAKSALMGAGADVLRGVSEMGQGAGQSLGLPSLEHLGDVGIQKAQALRQQAAEAVEAPQPYDPFYTKPMQMAGEVVGGVVPYMAGLAVAPEVVAPTLLAGTMGTQALGSMAGRADEQGKEFDVAPALPAAAAETAVNLVGLGTMGPLKTQLEKSFLREFAGKGAGDYIADIAKKEGYEAAEKAVGSKLSNIAAETGLNTAGISLGNVGSSIIERAQAGQSLTDPEAMDEYLKGVESGLMGGAMFGAPQGLGRRAAKEAAVEVEGAKMREAAPRPVPGEDTGWKATPEAPEPTTGDGAQFPPPEGTNWYDQLGLNKRAGAYKQLKQLDLADAEDHPFIKNILERNKGYADSASVENLFKHMEGIDTTEAQAKKEAFGKNLGQITGTYTDNLGRTGQFLSSVNNPELGTHVESGATKDTLQALRKSTNPVLRGLAHMARNLPNLKIWQDDTAIRDLEKRRGYPKGSVGGYYDMMDQGIRMASHTKENEHVVGHELTHALVAHAIDNPLPHQRPSVNALHTLFDTVKDHPLLQVVTPDVKRGKEYGITNVHEFVSEGMNNPEFQYKLSRIKYQNTTLWGKFTSAIANMLGLKKDNAFMELMTHTENLMPRKGTKITPIKKQLAGLSPEEVSRADQIKETTEPDVSRGPQPSLRQEGEGAAIRGEGIREGRPEGRAVEEVPKEALTREERIEAQYQENKRQAVIRRQQAAEMTPEQLQQLRDSAVVENDRLDLEAIKKHFGEEQATAYENMNRRERERWWDRNATEDLEDDSSVMKGIDENEIQEYIDAHSNVFGDNARELGRNVALHLRGSEKPDWVNSPDYVAVREAFKLADKEGWDRAEVIQGMRDRVRGYAGDDAPELFARLFKKEKAVPPTAEAPKELGVQGKIPETHPMAAPVERPPAAKPKVEAAGERPAQAAPAGRETDPDADYAVGRGLVKTKAADSRSVIQKMKDWYHDIEKSQFSPSVRLRAHLVSRYAPWTASLKDQDWVTAEGKLRADYMGSKYQQIFNTVRTGYDQGVGVVGSDGTVVIRPDDRLALGNIMNRVDKLKQFNNPREVTGFVLRALRGETLLQEDEANRQHIKNLRASADKAEAASERATKREDIIKEQKRADALRNEAKRLEEIYGKAEGEGREKRVTREDIEKAKSLMSRHAELKDIVNDVHDMNRALVDLWEQAELVDARTADKWRENPAYVPLYKSEEDLLTDPSQYVNMLGKGTKTVAEIDKLLGGSHDVNIFENLQKHYAFMTMGAAQNLLRKNSSEQLEHVGAMKKITEHEARNNPLAVMFKAHDKEGNAVKQYYEAVDPLTFEAFQAAQPLVHPLFTKVLRPTTSMFRKVTLMNPVFWFKQLVRDPIHASMVADTGIITPVHSAVAMAKILAGKSESYKKLQREGVVGAIEQFKDPKQFAESFGKDRGKIGRALDKLEHIHESSDAATRVAVYDASYARAKKRGMSDDQAHSFATNQAREVINFSNIGKSQAMQAIRASVPFFSATMNSLDVVARAAMGYGLPPAERARAKKLFYTRAIGLAALSTGYALAMQDDEDYRKLQNTNDWMKNYLIPNPAEKGTFIKVPIPFEIGYFTKVLPELWVRLASGTLNEGEAKRAAREGLLSTLPPVPLPLLLRTPIETVMNYDLFTGRPIERLGQENLPVEERGRREASELAKFMSKSLGLSQAGLSPAKIDHLGRGMLTELWGTTMLLSDAYLHRDNPRALKSLAESIPLAHGLFTKPDTERLVNTFYQAEEAAKQRRTAMRGDIKSGRVAEFKEAMQDPEKRAQYRAASPLRRIAENMSKLRHRMDLVDENKKLTQEQKTAEMKRLKESYNNLAIRGARLADKLGVEQ